MVEFDSAATVDGTFGLAGGRYDEGGYVYNLARGTLEGTGRDYYLRNTSAYTETFKTMENVPVMNVMMARTGMNSLQKRLGNLRDMNNKNNQQGIWARTYYKDMTVDDLIKTDIKLFGAEAGYDWLFMPDEPTKLYAGVMIGYMKANNIKTKKDNGTYEHGEGDAPSLGLYATLLNENNWFVDIAARNFWSKLDMKSHTSLGTELAYKPSRNVIALSAEAGKSFIAQENGNGYIRIEPKAEINYMNASSDSSSVKGGTGDLKYDSANYFDVKAGVLFAYNIKNYNGLLIEPLLELAYRQELIGTDKVSYGGATNKSNIKGGNVEINAGLNMQLTDDLYWYALGSYEAGSKISGWGLNAGIRFSFGNMNGTNKQSSVYTYSPKTEQNNKLYNNVYRKGNKQKTENTEKVQKDSSYNKKNRYTNSTISKQQVNTTAVKKDISNKEENNAINTKTEQNNRLYNNVYRKGNKQKTENTEKVQTNSSYNKKNRYTNGNMNTDTKKREINKRKNMLY